MKIVKSRYPLLLGLLAVALGVTSSSAAPLPKLAGTTTLISTWHSGAALVTLPKAVTVDLARPRIAISTPGRFGGLVIDDVGRRGPDRVGLLFTRMIAPIGCGYDLRCTSVETLAVRRPGSAAYEKAAGSLTLRPGTYRIYALNEAATMQRPTTIRFSLPGLAGSTTIRATQPVSAGLAEWSHSGPNTGSYDEHPENIPNSLGRFFAPTWSSGSFGGYPVDGLYGSGVLWQVPASSLLAGGVWRSPIPQEASSHPHTPASISMCWHVSRAATGLPDNWWQDPAANHGYFTNPYTPRCLDAGHIGVEQAFAVTREPSDARFQFRGSPIVEPMQRIGMFVISVRLLDAQ